LKDKTSLVNTPPSITYLDKIMDCIAAAAAPSPTNKAPDVPVAAVREHFRAPDRIADVLSQLQEASRRNNQLLATAALNANLGGLQAQQQAQQQNLACNLGHIFAVRQQYQPQQTPLVQQGSMQTHFELLATLLRSAAAAPSFGSS
jgi:hypothetical protein